MPAAKMLAWFFFSSRRRHTSFDCDWSSDVCSSDLVAAIALVVTQPALAQAPGRVVEVDTLEELEAAVNDGSDNDIIVIAAGRYVIDTPLRDRKSVVKGKRVSLGGRSIRNRNHATRH